MPAGKVVFRRSGGVVYLTLDRPRTGNRLSADMADALLQWCPALDQDPTVRLVVLTGRGACFSCGWEPLRPGQGPVRAAGALAAVHKPIIAAVNGDCTDQGLELALACDIRVAVPEARFGLTHTAHGLIPWDGGTQRLSRLLGPARAMEMLLLAELVDGQQAYQMGLVHRLAESGELWDVVEEVASRILGGASVALAYAKEAVHHGMDMTLEQGLRLEADLNFILHSTSDRAEGIRSFLERRSPRFTGE
ncbi:MAG: enoyl-CoA hydratase/isomerase family protein [Chloroflexi bacterium]|nr:enoyl-CoA hydratase/isomerase family protein [Chloroflexota bacterium]